MPPWVVPQVRSPTSQNYCICLARQKVATPITARIETSTPSLMLFLSLLLLCVLRSFSLHTWYICNCLWFPRTVFSRFPTVDVESQKIQPYRSTPGKQRGISAYSWRCCTLIKWIAFEGTISDVRSYSPGVRNFCVVLKNTHVALQSNCAPSCCNC